VAAFREPTWTDERIRRELLEFLSGREEWPTYREFQRAGRRTLRDAVTHHGGAKRWARKLGIRFVQHPPGYSPWWTDEHIRRELETFLAGRDEWPTRKEFEAAGRKPLRDAVGRTGGPQRWADELSLPLTNRRAGSRRVWTRELVEAELRAFLESRDEWPPKSEFQKAGLASLLTASYRYGGPRALAPGLGVRPSSRHGPAVSNRKWTDERIAMELARFCGERDTWPTAAEFEDAGLTLLYRTASLHGGIERWAKRLGFTIVEGRTRRRPKSSRIAAGRRGQRSRS
jgi:hypothetical protein